MANAGSPVSQASSYLSRYTHRVAISNSRLIACDQRGVTFKWKDYRAKRHNRYKNMTLDTGEFIRRFLIHVLPRGFHRIRHYGLLANHVRVNQVQRLRQLLSEDTRINDTGVDDLAAETDTVDDRSATSTYICKSCGAPKITDRIKMPESRNQRVEQKITNQRASNPHSSVENTLKHLLPPRGFLP